MDCARINLSHATEESILKTIEVIREVRKICNRPIAIMYDTKGPEFRTLEFESGGVTLNKGDTIRMSKTCIQGNEEEFGVNHSEAIDLIEVGNKVLIDNALLELEVIEKQDDYVVLEALGNGDIRNHKTVMIQELTCIWNLLVKLMKGTSHLQQNTPATIWPYHL